MPDVLAAVDDLMFLSRIREAARGAGREVRTVRGVDDVRGLLAGGPGGLLLVDLDSARLPVAELAAAARQSGAESIGFFSHVHSQRARDALAAGLTRALPRSQFVAQLPQLLCSRPDR